MRWPWSREPEPEPDAQGLNDARKAREDAVSRLREIREQTPEVQRIADSLRSIRKQNHFAERLEESIRRRDQEEGLT